MPQTTFAITASGDDAYVARSDLNGQTWPPPGGTGVDITDGSGNSFQVERSNLDYGQGRRYWLTVALLRFDTSSIPDGARIRSATLQLSVAFAAASVTLNVEWFPFDGSVATSDWTRTISNSAGSYASGAGGPLGIINIPLSLVQNVSTTGTTGFRLHQQIPVEPPTGDNSWYFDSFDSANQEPRLIVDYDLVNTFEGGTDGTTITTGNSGGVSGVAFDTVTIGTGYTVAYENNPVLSQSMGLAIIPGATSASSSVRWDVATVGTLGPTIYTRFYVWFSALASSTPNNRPLQLSLSGAQRCAIVFWGSVLPGKWTWANAADSGGTTSTMTMQANTIYRFECQWTLSATVGRAIINCYLGDSTTVLETMDSTANQNFGGTTFNSLDIGYRTNGTSSQYGTMLVDGFGLSTTGYLGPVDGISLPTTAALSGVSR